MSVVSFVPCLICTGISGVVVVRVAGIGDKRVRGELCSVPQLQWFGFVLIRDARTPIKPRAL